jgi:hypothetical protein
VSLDGHTGEVTPSEPPQPSPARTVHNAAADPSLSTLELLLRLLAEARGGAAIDAEAGAIQRRYARTFARRHVRLTTSVADEPELAHLDALAAALFGPGFTASSALNILNAGLSRRRRVPRPDL